MMGVLDFCRDKFSQIVPRRHYDINGDESIENGRYVVIDTELTGLDLRADSIVSIGAIRMTGCSISLSDTFYRMVNPMTRMRPETVIIHEITPSEVCDMPSVENILIELLGFCRDDILVGHFIHIDAGFLNKDMRRVYETNMMNYIIDTHRLYEWICRNESDFSRIPGASAENLDLATLAHKYRIPTNGVHNALMDAFITAQLFQRLLYMLPGAGVRTLRDLLRAGKP